MRMQPRYGVVGTRHRALAKADLGEPGAGAHERREGPRTYFGIEGAFIGLSKGIELARAVGNHAGEYIEPPGRTLRVRSGGYAGRKLQRFEQAHDIHAARLQYGAAFEVDLMEAHYAQPLGQG